jgi:hypothetical protein
MLRLPRTLAAWGTPDFEAILREETRQLGAEQLPLQQGLSVGNYALASRLDVMVIRAYEEGVCIRVEAGIFYTSVIAGCSCADDPTPVDENSEYCEVRFDIDRVTARTAVVLL